MGDRLKECTIVQIPCFTDERGSLCAVEGSPLIPFDPRRFYYIYNVAKGARRGCHAHSSERQLIIALSGDFRVLLDDGESRTEFHLHNPREGLYIPPLIWHEVHSFSPGSVCGVLASNRYDLSDHFESYEVFLEAVRKLATPVAISRS